jgi:hypothetical protein
MIFTDHMGMHQIYRDAQKDEKRFRRMRRLSKKWVENRMKRATKNRTPELSPINAI